MLKIMQLHLNVVLDKEDCNTLIDDLGEKYNLLLFDMKKNYLQELGLEFEDADGFIKEKLYPTEGALLGGDLIPLEPDSLMYYKIPDSQDSIEVGIIGDIDRPEFREFAASIKESIIDALEDPEMEWEHVKKLDASFNMLRDSARTITPSEEEIEASEVLSSLPHRELLHLIVKDQSIFMEKLMNQTKVENVEEIVAKFREIGLVNTDFALLCNKTGQQILKVPDQSALEDISKKGFKCFICGSSIADENLVRNITSSEFGKKILEDDYWFLVKVLHALKDLGLPYEEMLIMTDESPDTHIFLNVNNEAMMIHLCNRKLSLDDAYLTNAHIAAYKLKYMIHVSTGPMSILMKNHLMEINPNCSISFIEGLESLAERIHEIKVTNEKNTLESILKDMTSLTPLPVEDLIMKKIIPGGLASPTSGLEDVLFTESEPNFDAFDDTPLDQEPAEAYYEEGSVEDEIIEGNEEVVVEPYESEAIIEEVPGEEELSLEEPETV